MPLVLIRGGHFGTGDLPCKQNDRLVRQQSANNVDCRGVAGLTTAHDSGALAAVSEPLQHPGSACSMHACMQACRRQRQDALLLYRRSGKIRPSLSFVLNVNLSSNH